MIVMLMATILGAGAAGAIGFLTSAAMYGYLEALYRLMWL